MEQGDASEDAAGRSAGLFLCIQVSTALRAVHRECADQSIAIEKVFVMRTRAATHTVHKKASGAFYKFQHGHCSPCMTQNKKGMLQAMHRGVQFEKQATNLLTIVVPRLLGSVTEDIVKHKGCFHHIYGAAPPITMMCQVVL